MPPSVSVVPGSGTITGSDALALTISDSSGLPFVSITYVESGTPSAPSGFPVTECVWAYPPESVGSRFFFPGSLTLGGPGLISVSANISRIGAGWDANFTLYVVAVNTSGQITSQTYTYSVTPKAIDGATVYGLVPAKGSVITPQTVIQFTVTDSLPIGVVEVQVDQKSREVVFDGNIFPWPYNGSSQIAIPGGYQFNIARAGGWQIAPTFYVRALDLTFAPETLSP